MENFRQISKLEELKAILAKAPPGDFGIAWQTTGTERLIYPIVEVEIQDESLVFISSAPFQVNQAFPIYIKMANRNLVFRLSLGEYEYIKNQLKCRYPKDAKALEERAQQRTQLPLKVNVNLTLRALSPSTVLDTRIQLLDLSDGGLGGAITRLNQDFFLRTSSFQVVKVGDKNHAETALLTLEHITDQGQGNKMKVGFSLDKPLSDGFYQLLKLEMKKGVTR